MDPDKPAGRPRNPRFSSGPCAKPPTFSLGQLAGAALGRSHRAAIGRAKLGDAITRTRDILGIPEGHLLGIVPASDTGAMEMAMWNLLGARPVEVLAWESFGAGWASDVVGQLRLDAKVTTAEYGRIVDLERVDWNADVVFTWNGTTSGVRVPDSFEIPAGREGLTVCDATSAAFAQDLPWDRLDVATFSWQKALGGEAAHGMLALGPRAVERLEAWTPPWPLPKVFRLTGGGRLIGGIFEGATINTPSMLAVEDYLKALDWAASVGGLKGLIRRADANAAVIHGFCAARDWLRNLAADPETWSNTSVCLGFDDDRISDGPAFAAAVARRLETQNVAYDIGSHRDAPPGLRIWCGATVEQDDLKALCPWLDWAFETEIRESGMRTGQA